jgi:hypothetical protein
VRVWLYLICDYTKLPFTGKFEFIRSTKVTDEEPNNSVPDGGVSALLLISAFGALAMLRRRLGA